MKKKIYVIFKTHFDIGFTELAGEIIKRYGDKMLKDVIKTCHGTDGKAAGKRFVWTMSSWPLLQTFKYASPADRVEAERLAKTGQLVTHGLPFTAHTEFLGTEELMRMFSFAKTFCDKFGKAYPVSAKMTDVPGHSIVLPSVLSKAGIKFLHLGCNSCCTSPDVPTLFWWEGKDGGRVLTMYNKGGYGSHIVPPSDWMFPVYLSVQQSNDNIGPQSPEVIDNLQAQLDEAKNDSELIVASMDDFVNEIYKCDLSGLPVIKQDLADTWIHGVGTYPREVSMVRRLRQELTAIEKYAAFSGADINYEMNLIYFYSFRIAEFLYAFQIIPLKYQS